MDPDIMQEAQPESNKPSPLTIIEWVLRVSVACTFTGHGVFALGVKEEWVAFISMFGFSDSAARQIMPFVGCHDILLAGMVLIRPLPIRWLLVWMTFWAFFTALLRPLSGAPIWDMIERGANWGAPLALLLVLRYRNSGGPGNRAPRTP